MPKAILASCLSSKNIQGYPIFYNKLIEPNTQGSSILIIEETSPTEIREIIKKFKPNGIILKKGSLAGHTAGILDSSNIQLAICKNLPPVPLDSYIFIDGENEEIKIYENKSDFENAKTVTTKNKVSRIPKKIMYKGKRLIVKIDSKSLSEIENGILAGADGTGILRTEWLGFDQKTPPNEEDHYSFYQKAVDAVSPKILNIRLFDIGGDKLPTWSLKHKKRLESPLGLRGIRAMGDLSRAFENQIKAICKIAHTHKIGVVLPMITDKSEVIQFKNFLCKYASQKTLKNIQIGSMIETPSAALTIKDIFKNCDFVRIGPGDLSQFTLATLRDYISPEALSTDNIHKSTLKLIEIVAKEGEIVKKEVNMCLDFEPRKSLLKKLLKAGIRTFCVSASNIQKTRQLLAEISNQASQ